jgi:hypothetical protein
MAKPTIIPVSFKDNIEDRILLEWLNDRFEEYNGKSNYIKYVLRKEMKKDLKENKED